jgi:hypothetical protein
MLLRAPFCEDYFRRVVVVRILQKVRAEKVTPISKVSGVGKQFKRHRFSLGRQVDFFVRLFCVTNDIF